MPNKPKLSKTRLASRSRARRAVLQFYGMHYGNPVGMNMKAKAAKIISDAGLPQPTGSDWAKIQMAAGIVKAAGFKPRPSRSHPLNNNPKMTPA